MVMGKTVQLQLFSWCNLHFKFDFTLTKRWEAGNNHIIVWSMISKAEFSSERLVLFLYSICSIFL